MDFVKTFKITTEADSQVKIEGEIPFEELEAQRSAAIKHYGKDIEIDGFRKGHVPDSEIVKRVGEMGILSEMAERALAKAYPVAVAEHKLDVIGYPQVNITKIAPDNPLGFSITVAVVPEVTLPDYKKIAGEINQDKASTEVTDADVEDQTKDIMRQKLAYERMQAHAAKQAEKTEAEPGDLPTPETVGNENEDEGPKAVTDDEIPELTDEIVKELGQPGQFENVEDFKKNLREHLAIEKEREVNAAHRAKVTDAVIEETKVDLPAVLVDSEIDQMFAQMDEDIKRAGLKMEDYLEHIKKTREDLITEWKPAAEKRATLQLVLNEIAKVEEVKPDEKLMEEQVKALKEQYKDADEARVKVYVASILTNEAVMKLLEEC